MELSAVCSATPTKQTSPPVRMLGLVMLLSTFVSCTVACGFTRVPNALQSTAAAYSSKQETVHEPTGPASEDGSQRRQSSGGGPIRIAASYESLRRSRQFCEAAGQLVQSHENVSATVNCTSADILTDAKRYVIEYLVMPGAIRRVRNLLGLSDPISGPLRIPRSLVCEGFVAPSSHETDGIPDADMVIYVAAGAMETSDVVAYGTVCSRFSSSGRPAVGAINFNPRNVPDVAPAQLSEAAREGLVDTATHELIHTLGFVPQSLYNRSTDMVIAGVTRRIFTGPFAVAAMRSHTGCGSPLAGIELHAADHAHWSPKYLDGDLMTPSGGYRFTAMTANALVDLGVGYILNGLAQRETITWGANFGCGPFTEPCNTTAGGAGTLFCFDAARSDGCTHDRGGFGPCSVVTYSSDIPKQAFRYFPSSPRLGGYREWDYCPRYEPYAARRCRVIPAQSSATTATTAVTSSSVYQTRGIGVLELPSGNYFGEDSSCFAVTSDFAPRFQTGSNTATHRCVQSSCATPTMEVRVTEALALCPAGAVLGNTSLFAGQLQCPTTAGATTLCNALRQVTWAPSITAIPSRARSAMVMMTPVSLSIFRSSFLLRVGAAIVGTLALWTSCTG